MDFFGAALEAAFAVDFAVDFALALVAAALLAGFAFVAVVAPLSAALASAALAAAASARAVLLNAARALPAAVRARLANVDYAASNPQMPAYEAAFYNVEEVNRLEPVVCVPPSAALTLIVRRDLRRAAAFGWMAPAFAARSSAERASIRALVVASASAPLPATVRAFATNVFAAVRRGPRMS